MTKVDFHEAGQLCYKQFHENSINNTNWLTDGRTVWSECETAFYFEKNQQSQTYKYKDHREAADYVKCPQPVLDTCSMHLVTPVPKTCPQQSVHCAGDHLFCS